MHIVIDCRSVHRHMGGIGRAALDLVHALAQNPRGHRISMLIGAGHEAALPEEAVSVVTVDAAMIDERFEQFHLPSLLEAIGADLYLNTTFSIPAVKTIRRQVSIIHDVVFEDHPEYVEAKLQSYLSRWSRFAAANADHILTVSDHARGRIQNVYGVEDSRITRVYNGISPSCFDAPKEQEIRGTLRKYGLEQPYLLYLGTLELKKGVIELLRAFREAQAIGLPGTLVLAGGKGGPEFDLDAEIRNVGCVGRIRALGFVDEADKKALLKAASLFVYPSLYEGFGLPPLEAMAMGVPCVVSDRTSLPEIVGTAAMVTRIQAAAQFGTALVRGMRDEEFRSRAALAGPSRAREFSWGRSAQEILDICQRVGGN